LAVGKVICVELICVDGEGLAVVSGARLSRGLGDEEVLATLSAAARRRAVAGAGCMTGRSDILALDDVGADVVAVVVVLAVGAGPSSLR
jgi:hypothetical protein